jgi:hypothetical protein
MSITSTADVPVLDQAGKIPTGYLPTTVTTSAALTVAVGFVTASWGAAPARATWLGQSLLSGHVAADTATIAPGAVLVTGGAWTTGTKTVAITDTGTVLLRSTATALEVDRILSGTTPTWVSLDRIILP